SSDQTLTTETYTPSLHDALPICSGSATEVPPYFWTTMLMTRETLGAKPKHPYICPLARRSGARARRLPYGPSRPAGYHPRSHERDRKSTRLNSSHVKISYAVFCL